MVKEHLDELIKSAMLTKNSAALRTFRAIKTEFMKYTTARGAKPLDDSSEVSILRRMVNERLDASGQYLEAGRNDLSESELEEVAVLRGILPAEISREDLEKFADSVISEKSMKLMGSYVKQIKEKYPTADGKVIAEIVKQKLI